ncbi:aminodeoxychorismate/anthranilate synthase component II [Clostridia bacterium]|nr:aminodeoxychorismate/anthranilate synthase component II [Clostridia bacterium]
MILLVDNYDSFTYNLAQYIAEFEEVKILRNDDENLIQEAKKADRIVLSPGPGEPKDAGKMEQLLREIGKTKPILGICLGHQAIGEVYGAKVVRAKEIRHGKVSLMRKIDCLIFQNLPEEIEIMRYHSLIVNKENLPESILPLGFSLDDEEMMAMHIADSEIYGLQFHPESIGTPWGKQMIQNFLTVKTAF